ncbi:MAG: outer membrane beta-barrel protein [Candidatus Sulfopaludibacter sp.]|nr:outer membrane beta-barrel protein [Candidatus Sulfopaludibacter sp.]
MTIKAILPLLFAAPALAQPFSAGLKVGLPLTDFVNTVNGASASTQRYLVGPTAELHLPWGFGVEVDALYRHFNYRDVIGSTTSALGSVSNVGDWEFPLLLKYRFPAKVIRPYIDAGVAFDRLSGFTSAVTGSPEKGTTMGAVVGAGIDIHILILHVLPEVRYTRWTSQHFNIANVLSSNQNQAEVMVGITF